MQPPPHPSVRAMTLALRVGAWVSTALLALGLIAELSGLGPRSGDMLLRAGLVILMATPVTNLLIAIVDEVAAREWPFVAIGVVVLLLLACSLTLALR